MPGAYPWLGWCKRHERLRCDRAAQMAGGVDRCRRTGYQRDAGRAIVGECLENWSTMLIVDTLDATRRETLERFLLDDAEMEHRYAPGKWSIRFLLHHLADAETVLFDRIRRVLSEPRGVVWAFDQDAWAQGLEYDRRPLDLSRRIYEAARDGVIYYARSAYSSKGHLEFVHSGTGVRTLKDEFDKVAWHNEHHLAQIRAALSGP